MFQFLYSGSCAAAFCIIYIAVVYLRRLPRNRLDKLVVTWGVAYVMTLWFFWSAANVVHQLMGHPQANPNAELVTLTVAIGLPGALSSALVGWARKSMLVASIVMLGTCAAIWCFATMGDERFFIAPAVWNAVFLVAVLFSPKARRVGCNACGYDLTKNPSGICPECGKPTAPINIPS